MGGRGSTSSLEKLDNYGKEFKEVTTNLHGKPIRIRDKRVLFIESRLGKNKTPFESMRSNRVYVLIHPNKRNVHAVIFTDRMGHAKKFIDVNASHDEKGFNDLGHVHVKYDRIKSRGLRKADRKLLRKILIANGESVLPQHGGGRRTKNKGRKKK